MAVLRVLVERLRTHLESTLVPEEEFVELLKRHLDIGDRVLHTEFGGSLRGYGMPTVFVTLINLPKERVKERWGASEHNNRIMFTVKFLDKGVQVEQSLQGLDTVQRLRKKTGKPDAVAIYLAKYINDHVKAVQPR